MKALLSAILLSVIGASAFAQNTEEKGAFLIDLGAGTCKVPDGDKNVVTVNSGLRIATLSENNNMVTSCWGHDPAFAASDGKTKRYTETDISCFGRHPLMGEMKAHKVNAVVTPSGSVQMKCHFRFGD